MVETTSTPGSTTARPTVPDPESQSTLVEETQPITADIGSTLFLAPQPRGTGTGESSTDAAGFGRLNEFVSLVGPGGVIELAADAGPYLVTEPLVLSAGGDSGRPVTIRGSQGGPRVEFVGTRADPYDPLDEPGRPLFRLERGADHLAFANFDCIRMGNGCFLVVAPITDLTITGIHAANVRRFFETAAQAESTATIAGLNISNVEISGFSKGAIRLAYDTHDVVISDVVGDSLQYDGDNFAVGVHLLDSVHDVRLQRVTMNNARDTLHDYWNGDGFAAERGVYNVLLTDTSASGNTDAGYDLKASGVRLVNAEAHGNKRNFRLWGREVILESCIGTDPELRGGAGTQAQLHLAEAAYVEVIGCTFTDSDPETIVFDIVDQSHLVIRTAYVEHSSSARLSAIAPGAAIEYLAIEVITR